MVLADLIMGAVAGGVVVGGGVWYWQARGKAQALSELAKLKEKLPDQRSS